MSSKRKVSKYSKNQNGSSNSYSDDSDETYCTELNNGIEFTLNNFKKNCLDFKSDPQLEMYVQKINTDVKCHIKNIKLLSLEQVRSYKLFIESLKSDETMQNFCRNNGIDILIILLSDIEDILDDTTSISVISASFNAIATNDYENVNTLLMHTNSKTDLVSINNGYPIEKQNNITPAENLQKEKVAECYNRASRSLLVTENVNVVNYSDKNNTVSPMICDTIEIDDDDEESLPFVYNKNAENDLGVNDKNVLTVVNQTKENDLARKEHLTPVFTYNAQGFETCSDAFYRKESTDIACNKNQNNYSNGNSALLKTENYIITVNSITQQHKDTINNKFKTPDNCSTLNNEINQSITSDERNRNNNQRVFNLKASETYSLPSSKSANAININKVQSKEKELANADPNTVVNSQNPSVEATAPLQSMAIQELNNISIESAVTNKSIPRNDCRIPQRQDNTSDIFQINTTNFLDKNLLETQKTANVDEYVKLLESYLKLQRAKIRINQKLISSKHVTRSIKNLFAKYLPIYAEEFNKAATSYVYVIMEMNQEEETSEAAANADDFINLFDDELANKSLSLPPEELPVVNLLSGSINSNQKRVNNAQESSSDNEDEPHREFTNEERLAMCKDMSEFLATIASYDKSYTDLLK